MCQSDRSMEEPVQASSNRPQWVRLIGWVASRTCVEALPESAYICTYYMGIYTYTYGSR